MSLLKHQSLDASKDKIYFLRERHMAKKMKTFIRVDSDISSNGPYSAGKDFIN